MIQQHPIKSRLFLKMVINFDFFFFKVIKLNIVNFVYKLLLFLLLNVAYFCVFQVLVTVSAQRCRCL